MAEDSASGPIPPVEEISGSPPAVERSVSEPDNAPGSWALTIEPPGEPQRQDSASLVADRFAIGASIVGHVLVLLWVAGSLASTPDPAERVIPIKLVPATALPKTAPAPPAPAAKPADRPEPPKTKADAAPAEQPGPDRNPPGSKTAALAPVGKALGSRPTTLSPQELDALSVQAKRCWKIPTGWTDPHQVTVTVRFRLNRDGTLDGAPVVVEFPASELGKTAALGAMHAVAECGPFRLPADKYDQWRDVQLRLAP